VLDLVGKARAAVLKGTLSFALPLDGSAVLLAFLVKVEEYKLGLFQEALDVVPDQRFDDIAANARVVAGRAALARPLPVQV
jgi:hypothetical protein